MSSHEPALPTFDQAARYRIRIEGHLDERWSDYLGGLEVHYTSPLPHQNITLLTGTLLDQAALIGVLNTLYNLRLTLLSVERLAE
ncbi:MAG TPA: hypothetical protein P5526_23355 [Anaerolineae bacterium]|nr:hypothetical protein [Anaerolineae bacterium]HRV95115.1 hypothetical protein [Anaerolineae bacterium]